MFLDLPWSEKNKEFLDDMKRVVPRDERKWDGDRKMWWISDGYLDEVDSLLFHHFEQTGSGREAL